MNQDEFYWGDEEKSTPASTKTVASAPQQETMGTDEFAWEDSPAVQPEVQPQASVPQASILPRIMSIPGEALSQAYDVLDVAGTNVDAKLTALASGVVPGLSDETRKSLAERSANLSRYAKAKAAKMGTPNQILAGLAEAAPLVAGTMATGGASLFAAPVIAGADVAAGAAQRQAEKFGEVGIGRALEGGAGAALTEAALDYGARKLPVAKPLAKVASGLMHSGAASGQASAWEDYGTGEDVDLGKAALSAGAGAVVRGGFEGIKYSSLNKSGLKGAEEANSVTTGLGTSRTPQAEGFARSAGIGKNTLAGYNQQMMDAPSSARAFEEFENMTAYTRSPEAQDAVVSDVITDMRDSMGDVLTRKNLDYTTADGRNVAQILGLDEKQMLKSGETMFKVDAPIFGGTKQKLDAETTASWLDAYNKKGKDLINKRAGAYDTMIAKVDEQINIDTNLRQDVNVDTTQLNNLKTNLGKIREAMMNYSKGGDVRELTDAIDIYGAQAMRYAANTGMMNKLHGVRGKGEPFNPAYDLQYMKSLNDSLTAADPSFFRRSTGETIVEGGEDVTKQALSLLSKVPVVSGVRSALGARAMRKEKQAASELFGDVSTALARQPSRPTTPTPSDKVDMALRDGDFDGASRASEEALSDSGITPMRGVEEPLEVSASRVDDIVNPRPTEDVVVPPQEDLLSMDTIRSMLPARSEAPIPRPVEEPTITPEPVDPFSRPSQDLAPPIRAEEPAPVDVPVEAPVRAVEEIVPEPVVRPQPDLEMARTPSQRAEEPTPVVEPAPKVEEVVPEPKPTTKASDLAAKPKTKEKVEEPAASKEEPEVEAPKAEPKKSEPVPVKRPTLKTVLDKVKGESKRLSNLPLSTKTREDAITAANLKKTSAYLEDQAKRLTAKDKYTDDEVAEMIDSSIKAAGGLEKLGNVADFKRAFNIDKMESDHAKRLAEKAATAEAKAKKITDKIATTEEARAKRKAEREAEAAEAKSQRAAEKAKLVKESHDTVKKYAADEGFEDADVSSVLKKLGVTSDDAVNPVRARAELEKIRANREAKTKKELDTLLKKSQTTKEIAAKKVEVANKLDKVQSELGEVKAALKKAAQGEDRTKLIRRREELESKVKELDRVKEDIGNMESTEAVQKRITSAENKMKASERNIEDLESQLKQIENAMMENGATKVEVDDYLSNRFDIRRLPIESIDNARNQAVKHAKKLREADKAAEEAEIKKAEQELVAEVKSAGSEAEVQGIMDAVTKNISNMLKDPKFIKEHQAALDMMKAVGKAAKHNPAVEKHKANAWGMYFDILAEGARRKAAGVKDKHLVDNIALKELREEYQKMRGIEEGASTTAGRFWTDIKTVLTGDPNFKFEAESKKGALGGMQEVRAKLQKAKEKQAKPKKVSIDDYM